VSAAPPTRLRLGDDLVLRMLRVSDAPAVACAVRESLEHLRPWMPWADEASTDETFQRQRLRGAQRKAAVGEEWQYGLFAPDESVIGNFGLLARRPTGSIEIGYWVHAKEIGRGLATRASEALTNASLTLDGVSAVCIRCDELNSRSAAVPRRLGFTLVRTEEREPQAPAESGRLMIWERREPIALA